MLKLSQNAIRMLVSKYRAVLKNMRIKEAALVTACALVAFSPVTADAAFVYNGTYTGITSDMTTPPSWFHDNSATNMLYVWSTAGTPLISQKNNLTINFDGTNAASVPDYVFGGASSTANVSGHTVNLISGKVTDAIYGGYFNRANASSTANGNVTGNTVNISSAAIDSVASGTPVTVASTVVGDVYGGYIHTGNGTVEGNFVNISAATDGTTTLGTDENNFVVGGVSSGDGNVIDNTVNISTAGTGIVVINSIVAGGASFGDGDVTGNKVNISATEGSSVTIGEAVVGGASLGEGNVTDNHVKISQSGTPATLSFADDVIGGYVEIGSGTTIVSDNSVTISAADATFSANISGGQIDTGSGTDIVSGNTVTVSAGEFNGKFLQGGYIYQGEGDTVIGNTVVFSNGTGVSEIYGGRIQEGYGNVIENIVDIDVNTAGVGLDAVYGGFSDGIDDGEITGNKVFIDSKGNGTINVGLVVGGASGSEGTVSDNIVEISGRGIMVGGVVGGSIGDFGGGGDGDVTGNKVTISNNASADFLVVGGRTFGDGDVIGNSVSINGANVGAIVSGGASFGTGDIIDNHVTISGSSIVGNAGFTAIAGGRSFSDGGDGDVIGNTVTIENGTIDASSNMVVIAGGLIDPTFTIIGPGTGDVTGNTVTINGGKIGTIDIGATDVIIAGGGTFGEGDAIGNELNINGGTIGKTSIIADVTVGGGVSVEGVAKGNTVTMTDGTIFGSLAGGASGIDIDGGTPVAGTAQDNTVNISGGTVKGDVVGGFVGGTIDPNSSSSVTDNTVTIFGGTFEGDISGGYIDTGSADGDNITGNTVIISGGDVKSTRIAGGYLQNTVAAEDAEINLMDNTVIIADGTNMKNANIYGGYIHDAAGATGDIKITDNTVVIFNGVDLTKANIFGGLARNAGVDVDVFTGNTLAVYGKQEVASINEFQNYGFFLPSDTVGGDIMLKTGNWVIEGGDEDNLKEISVGIAMDSVASPAFRAGDQIKLIDSDKELNEFVILAEDSQTVSATKGIMLAYDFELELLDNLNDAENITDTDLVATVVHAGAQPQTKAFSEARLAGLGFVNQGADFLAGEGIADATMRAKEAQGGVGMFGAIGYGHTRYKSGSHVDVDGLNLLLGVASRSESSNGSSLLKGLFFEGGWGSYDGYNSFNSGNVNSDGDVSYYGVGVLLRNDTAGGTYVEGSLRTGKTKTTFNSNDFALDGGNVHASYDSKPSYFGAHLGVGRAKTNDSGSTTDFYAKYFYTHQGGDDVTISTGDTINFSSSDSNRLRLGARFTKERPNGKMATYAGAAYEYEFSGDAKASTYGYEIDAPSIKGSTGILELGLIYKNSPTSANTVYFGLEGYFGKRQGVRGNIQFKHAF